MAMIENKKDSKKFIILFAVITVIILGCVMTVNYIVDPFFQYRVKDNSYILNPQFSDAGLIKNYDYNSIILGSSMVQNYDLDLLKKDSDLQPLKLTLGGLNIKEAMAIDALIDKNKINTYIINIDISSFAKDIQEEKNRFPSYLFGDSPLDQIQYLLAYETTVRYTPVDIGVNMYLKNKDKNEISRTIKNKISIDKIGNFGDLAIYNNVEKVKNEYLYGYAVSMVETENLDARLKENLDTFFSSIDIENNPTIDYIFVLPPYSALYWFHTKLKGYYSNYTDFIYTFIEETGKYNNVKIVCFYDLDEITDLNNYSDLTHFNPAISDKIVNNLFTPDYILDLNNIDQRLNKLDSLTNTFTEENKEWLSKKRK
jgi:hypothetical protein